jgi:monoamine oxidase
MDVIIIGAGLAGLAVLDRLSAGGVRPLVLEARDRVGGRVLTQHTDGDVAIELGPEWLDGKGIARHLLDAQATTVVNAEGAFWVRGQDGLQKSGAPYSQRLFKQLRAAGRDRSVAAALRSCCGGVQWREQVHRLTRYVEGFHAGDPERLSLRWFLETEASQSAMESMSRVPAGIDRLVEKLRMPRADIRTGTVVREIRWSRGRVRVRATHSRGSETWEADKAVITVPVWLLQNGRIRFRPGLGSRRRALEKIGIGAVQKFVFTFRQPFWESIEPFDNLLMLHAIDQKVPTWWTLRPLKAAHLVGWVGGPSAERLGRRSIEARLKAAIDSLAAGLGIPARLIEAELTGWRHHDWLRDPWSRGAYSYVLTGGLDAWRTLSRPIEGTLFFAGEGTAAHGFNGTIDGAIATGWRAAREVLGE